ncbi:hypothetical protein DNTS_021459 [Danionella cerebrum]|uniref:Transmembrane protein 100 n=1 Tax=Danionella cerebrum TaxID=2873325 RepID=A0A553R2L8_9TELE|nr:hypothetical protein DNTS_021459 [Danionella translucida]
MDIRSLAAPQAFGIVRWQCVAWEATRAWVHGQILLISTGEPVLLGHAAAAALRSRAPLSLMKATEIVRGSLPLMEGTTISFTASAHPSCKMGCTTGHFTCQPQTTAAPTLESQLQEAGPKVPEVLSSLERLSQATGGMEKSWYRCIFPFGIISLVIGVAGTGVTYTYNDLPQTKVVSMVLLIVGLILVLVATACWMVHMKKKKRRKKKEGGSFSSEQKLRTEVCGKYAGDWHEGSPESRTQPPAASSAGCRGWREERTGEVENVMLECFGLERSSRSPWLSNVLQIALFVNKRFTKAIPLKTVYIAMDVHTPGGWESVCAYLANPGLFKRLV